MNVTAWDECLDLATERTVVQSPVDSSLLLAQEIGKVGLARLLLAQMRTGGTQTAALTLTPGASPSRNRDRCAAGYITGAVYSGIGAYGGAAEVPVVPVGALPNACGLAVIGLDRAPDVDDLFARAAQLVDSPAVIDGIPITPDFATGNHFIEVFRTSDATAGAHPFIALIHCSVPELKGDNTRMPGISPIHSETVRRELDTVQRDIGVSGVLVGQTGEAYLERFAYAAEFSISKRRMIADRLFPEGTLVANVMHMGLAAPGQLVIGNHVHDGDHSGLPFLMGPGVDSVLLRTGNNASNQYLSHGGGYEYGEVSGSEATGGETGQQRIRLRFKNGNIMECPDVTDLAYSYRGQATLDWLLESGEVEVLSTITPIYCLRTQA